MNYKLLFKRTFRKLRRFCFQIEPLAIFERNFKNLENYTVES